jgi:dipeptidyl aminopeptidase/acylaminoacyl peptidase
MSRGGTWGIEDTVVFAASGGLFRVPASGGLPMPLVKAESGPYLWPQFLPDGRHIVVLTRDQNTANQQVVLDARTAESVAIGSRRGRATVVGDTLLFSSGTTLGVQQIDPGRGALAGEARTLGGVEDLSSSADDDAAFSASSTVLVYRRASTRLGQLTWIERTGHLIGAAGEPGEYEGISVSPSGRRVAVIRRDARDSSSLWILDGERLNRVTSGTSHDAFPIWSPDETRIAYFSARSGKNGLYAVVADGGESETVLLEAPVPAIPTDWSRDGRSLLYSVRSSTTGSDVWALPIGGDGKPKALLQSPSNESHAVMSPDGRWIAYVSDESGGDEVYVRRFPSSQGQWQISIDGGTRPQWAPDGHELFFASDGKLMSVEIASAQEGAPRLGMPRSWFMLREATEYAVSRSGRILVLMPIGDPARRQLEVVMNWAR